MIPQAGGKDVDMEVHNMCVLYASEPLRRRGAWAVYEVLILFIIIDCGMVVFLDYDDEDTFYFHYTHPHPHTHIHMTHPLFPAFPSLVALFLVCLAACGEYGFKVASTDLGF